MKIALPVPCPGHIRRSQSGKVYEKDVVSLNDNQVSPEIELLSCRNIKMEGKSKEEGKLKKESKFTLYFNR